MSRRGYSAKDIPDGCLKYALISWGCVIVGIFLLSAILQGCGY